MKQRERIAPISAKQQANRRANGEHFIASTIAKKPTPPLSRRAPVKRKKRTAKEDLRIYGPKEFRDYLHAHECLGCGFKGKPTQMQQAHVHTGAGLTGREADA